MEEGAISHPWHRKWRQQGVGGNFSIFWGGGGSGEPPWILPGAPATVSAAAAAAAAQAPIVL